jgi:hypothetical protein
MASEVKALPCACPMCDEPCYENYTINGRWFCEQCAIECYDKDGGLWRYLGMAELGETHDFRRTVRAALDYVGQVLAESGMGRRTTSGRARGARTNGTPPAVGTARPV